MKKMKIKKINKNRLQKTASISSTLAIMAVVNIYMEWNISYNEHGFLLTASLDLLFS